MDGSGFTADDGSPLLANAAAHFKKRGSTNKSHATNDVRIHNKEL